MYPILAKTGFEMQKGEVMGDWCIPAKACWVQPGLGDFLIQAMCPLMARWPIPQLPLWWSGSSGTTHHNGLETGENQAGEECWNHFKNLWRENL